MDLVDALLGLLGQQAEMDLKSLEVSVGKTFGEAERAAFLVNQKRSYQQTFVTWGITNKTFVETVQDVFPEHFAQIKHKTSELQ